MHQLQNPFFYHLPLLLIQQAKDFSFSLNSGSLNPCLVDLVTPMMFRNAHIQKKMKI